MQQDSPFKIYDASAGSGKTFTLVRALLLLLFKSKKPMDFKKILAITFTNKAVGEMKSRLISYLKQFSDERILNSDDFMFNSISKELKIDKNELHSKSKRILNTILHNYAALNVSTIDGFNHTLIRTFAHDLKLPVNFEVELDTKLLLQKAVDQLIAQAGKDKKLTKTLVDFALEKADDDKSWDISRDLNTIASLLVNENHNKHLEQLNDIELDDFEKLKRNVSKEIHVAKKKIETTTVTILNTFENNNLTKEDFNRGTLYNHFFKASQFQFKGLYGNNLEKNLEEEKNIYTQKLDDAKKDIIDKLLPDIRDTFHRIKNAYYKHEYYSKIHQNLTPLSLLNAINKTLNAIKSEDNKMLISEFNSIISNEIKHQPTPFIYERIGEKINHFFIDEFQDTSELQWQNLKPLIGNTLSGENLKGETGTAMIVGDAKQAIYRWRGGKAEQFLGLINTEEPFMIPKQNIRLESNYRSFKTIVDFNNNFFQYCAKHSINKSIYEDLFHNAPQNITSKNQGAVSISFIDYKNKEESEELYAIEVLKHIKHCLSLNYDLKDLCVLVRRKHEAKVIANYLGEHSIKFTSSDSLLLKNSNDVLFLNALLAYLIDPENPENRLTILKFLAEKENVSDKHAFYETLIHLKPNAFNEELQKNYPFYPNRLKQQPLYEIAESLVRTFHLVPHSNAYVQFYLETILEFSQTKIGGITAFLDYFETQKNTLKVSTSNHDNAVQIMTIHSSKGLEFPVVIYPFVDMDIYKEKNPQEWVSIENEFQESPIKETLVNYNKDFEKYNEKTKLIFEEHQSKLELDAINVFYVALTRPVEKLFIIAKKEKSPKSNTYQGLLYNYLIEIGNSTNEDEIIMGDLNTEKENSETNTLTNTITPKFISVSKETHAINMVTTNGELWDTNQEEAIKKGNHIHNIMSRVYVKNDLESAIDYYILKNEITSKEAKELYNVLKTLLNDPKLSSYYSSDIVVYNETDILTKGQNILRPDRFIINTNNEVAIIDYKTGLKNPKYKEQLYSYKDAIEEMNYNVTKMLLIYINDKITIEEV